MKARASSAAQGTWTKRSHDMSMFFFLFILCISHYMIYARYHLKGAKDRDRARVHGRAACTDQVLSLTKYIEKLKVSMG